MNTMAKLLLAMLAKDITHLSEKHQLLPVHHFGGHPGRSTTDSLHLLVDTIKVEWRRKQVVLVLFLDIEGVFLNVVTSRLLHNLRRWRIPEEYMIFIENMLMGRRNRLKFDIYMSDWFQLDNGIVQGDLLSMVLYLFYNADMLDVAQGWNEMCLGYIDDMALVASGHTLQDTHWVLGSILMREGGVNSWSQWSASHHSTLEPLKSVLVDFSRSKTVERPNMQVQGVVVQLQEAHKFLGVILDQELRWQQQVEGAIVTCYARRRLGPGFGFGLGWVWVRVWGSNRLGFSKWVAAPTRLSCPGFSHEWRASHEERRQDKG